MSQIRLWRAGALSRGRIMVMNNSQLSSSRPATPLDRDLRILARFIDIYCRGRHADAPRQPVCLKGHDVTRLHGRKIVLCEDCARLLAHAFTKREHCPMDPKPSCKHCTEHCYHPRYRQMIREVMRYSGRRLVLTGRLDYLIKLLF